jgi:hypothetical protein
MALPDVNARCHYAHYTNGSSIGCNTQLPYTLAPPGLRQTVSGGAKCRKLKTALDTTLLRLTTALYVNTLMVHPMIFLNFLLDADRCFDNN